MGVEMGSGGLGATKKIEKAGKATISCSRSSNNGSQHMTNSHRIQIARANE